MTPIRRNLNSPEPLEPALPARGLAALRPKVIRPDYLAENL